MKIYRGINSENDGQDGSWWTSNPCHAEIYAADGGYWNSRVHDGAIVTASIKEEACVVSFELPEDLEEGIHDEYLFNFIDSLDVDPDIVRLPDWEGEECFFVINFDAIEIIDVEEID